MKTRSLRYGARRGVVAGGQVIRRGDQRGGVAVATSRTRGTGDKPETGETAGRAFARLLDRAVDSGGWLLIVVSLFILLPVGVLYLASKGMKDSEPVKHVHVEADILKPVNILAD
jgi:hypothetical protein